MNPKVSENGFCVSLLNWLIQDLSDYGASKEESNLGFSSEETHPLHKIHLENWKWWQWLPPFSSLELPVSFRLVGPSRGKGAWCDGIISLELGPKNYPLVDRCLSIKTTRLQHLQTFRKSSITKHKNPVMSSHTRIKSSTSNHDLFLNSPRLPRGTAVKA